MTAPSKLVALTLLTLCLAGCRLPDVLSTQPSEDDDIDGFTDKYAAAGTSTQMDSHRSQHQPTHLRPLHGECCECEQQHAQ